MPTTRQRFDAAGMVAAFDAQRRARGLTWAAVNREVRIAPSTIRNMATGPIVEMDGVLGVTAWVGRSVESFYRDAAPGAGEPRHRTYERMDVRAVHAAMEAKRQAAGLSWAQAAAEIAWRSGVPIAAGGLTRLKGGGRMDLYHTLAVCDWLGARVAAYARNLGW